MKSRLQYCVFSLTVFSSALLLFVVQPMYAKMIIPTFGGSASVWTTCMLFFQITLVLGYCYSHFLLKYCEVRVQVFIQISLLLLGLTFLPFEANLASINTSLPISELFLSALKSIGFPFFILSTSAPLMQKWFSNTNHSKSENPYFLYAASNLGSLLALIVYPLYLERNFGVSTQLFLWQSAYAFLICLAVICSYFVVTNQTDISHKNDTSGPVPSWGQKGYWVILAFVPSSLMLGLTSYVTTDIAPVSLFWVIPLGLYLLSFVIVFSDKFSTSERSIERFILFLFFAMAFAFNGYLGDKVAFLIINVILFFSLSVFFHYKIAISKPVPHHLTEFYIWMAVGGMLGGIFNSLIAPIIFKLILEYWLVLAFAFSLVLIFRRTNQINPSNFIKEATNRFCWFLSVLLILQASINGPTNAEKNQTIFYLYIAIILGSIALCLLGSINRKIFLLNFSFLSVFTICCLSLNIFYLFLGRSFYSSIKVDEKLIDGDLVHAFSHGTTMHGLEIFSPPEKNTQLLAYYHFEGIIGEIIKYFISPAKEPLNIGVIGLGCGTLSCMKRESDSMDFFEIDGLVENVARDGRYFKYLEKCPANVFLGDGRITLGNQPNSNYDMLVLDAFSSDSIPTHLLTQEAIDLYFTKLKKNGALAIHVSNRFLDLSKVIANYNLPNGNIAILSKTRESTSPLFLTHAYVILLPESELSEKMLGTGEWTKLIKDAKFNSWTDDFTSIVDVLK